MNKALVLYYLFSTLFIIGTVYSAQVGTPGVNPTNPSLIAPSDPFTGGYAIKFPPGTYEGTIQAITIGSSFTIDFWVRFTKVTNSGLFNFLDSASNADIQFGIQDGKLTGRLVNDAGTQTFTVQAPVAVAVNSWYHVAFTASRDQNKACIIFAQYGASFSDDILQSIQCENGIAVPASRTWNNFVIGTDGRPGVNRFEGFVDDLRFWSRFFDEASLDGLEDIVDSSDETVKHWYNFNDNSFAYGARDVASGSKHMAFLAQTAPFFVHPQFEDPVPLPVTEACGGWGDIHLTSPTAGNRENQGVAGIQLVYAPQGKDGKELGIEVRLVYCSGTITCGTGIGWRAHGETFVYDGRGYEPWSNGLRRGLRFRDAAGKLRIYPGCRIGNDNPEKACTPAWASTPITTGVGSRAYLTTSGSSVTLNVKVPGEFEIVFTDLYPWGSSGYSNYQVFLPKNINRGTIEGICRERFRAANYNYFDIVKDNPPEEEIPPPIDNPPEDNIPPVDDDLKECATLLCNDTSLVALEYRDDCWMEIALGNEVIAGLSAAEQTYLDCLRKQNERTADQDFVECPKPCPNFCSGPCQGKCVEGECVCEDGWLGKDCSVDGDSVCVEATVNDGTKTPITIFISEQSVNTFYSYKDRASRSNIAQSNGLVVAVHQQKPLTGDKDIADKLEAGSAPITSLVLLADKANDQFGGELDITVAFDNGAGASINPVAIAVGDDIANDAQSSDPTDSLNFDGTSGNLKFKWIPQTTDGVAFTNLPETDWCAKVTINRAVSLNRVYLADGSSATQCGPHVSLLGCVKTSGSGQVERQAPTCTQVETFTVCSTACQDECIAITDCTECRTNEKCGWCASSGTCLSGTASGPTGGQCDAWRWEIDEATSRIITVHDNAFNPVRTDFIQAFLAPNDPLDTFVQFAAPCPSFPVDLNLLVERADPGAFIIGGLVNTWEAIYDGLQSKFEGSRFGLSTFVDTPISPAGSSFDYIYQQHFSLLRTDDSYRPFIRQQIEGLSTLGGLDEKNGQLSALVKLATNNDNAAPPRYGFAMRVAVIVTNSPYHVNGEEPSATAPAYPTVAGAGAALLKAGIFPVFIVGTDSMYTVYNNLVSQWGFGLVKKIDEQFSNLGAAVLSAIDAAEASAYVVADPSDDRIIVTKPYTYTDIQDGTTVSLPVTLGLNFKRQAVNYFETRFRLYVAGWGTVDVIAGKADKPVPNPQQEFIVMEDEPSVVNKVITLELSTFYDDSIESVISVVPDKGALYQVTGGIRDPVKGEQITNAGTVVTDKFRRVIFEAPADANGKPYTQFSWIATDDCDASGAGVVIITVTAVEDNPRTLCVANEKEVNIDEDTPVVVVLDGVDPDTADGVVSAQISALPKEGQLFQYDESADQKKGAQITTVNTVVTDAQYRVVYQPAKDSNRDASFSYVSSKLALSGKKTLLSTPCRIVITINPVNDPPMPFVEPPTTWGFEDTDLLVKVGCYDVDVEETEIRVVRLTSKGTLHDTNPAQEKLAEIAVNAFIEQSEYKGDGYTYAYVIYDPTSTSGYGNPYDDFDIDCRDPQQVFSPEDATAIIALEFVNDIPETNEPEPQVVTTPEDTPITITLSGTDEEDGDNVTPYISTVPEKGTLYQIDGVTPIPDQANPVKVEDPQGRVIYVPPQDEFKVGDPYTWFDFVVVDSNGSSSSEREVPVFVTPVNDQPIATGGGDYVTNEDTPVLIPLPGKDDYFGETPASELISIITTLPTKGTLYVGDTFEDAVEVELNEELPRKDVWYMPFPNQNGEDYDTFWYQVWDTNTTENLGYSESVKVTIDVNPVNDVPVPQSDNGIGCEDFDITVCVGGVDPDVITNADTLSAVITALPKVGEVYQLSEDGTRGEEIRTAPATITHAGNPDNSNGDYHEVGCFVFVPAPNAFDLAYATFEYKVVDSAQTESSPLVVSIDVLPVNDPPNAAGSDVTGDEDTELLIDTLRGYDDPSENHTIVGVITKLPENGNLFQSDRTPITTVPTNITDPDLKVIYYPNADLFGSPLDTISFYVEDIPPAGFVVPNPPPQCAQVTSMKSDEITININVLSKPDTPLVTSIDEYDTCENTTVDITVTATDPENDDLRLFIMSQPETGVILIGDTEVSTYPVQIGDVQKGEGSWTFTYWPKNDAAETATQDNNGIYNILYKVYDGVETVSDTIIMDVKQAVYPQHTLKVNVIPSNDPPYILLNGTNADLNDKITVLSDVAEYNLRTAQVVDVDSDQQQISLTITADKGVIEYRSVSQSDGVNYENVIIDSTGPSIETGDGGRSLTINGTVYEINEFLQNTWWKSDDKENDVSLIFTSDDFGRTGDPRCDNASVITTDTKTIFLTYESVGDDDKYIAPVAASSAALAAGVFLAGAGVAAAYKILRATKVVDGVDAVKFDDGLFSNTVDNPLYAQNGAQSSNIYEGAL